MDGAGSLIFFEREDKGVIERTQIWEVAFLTNQPFWELAMIHENFFSSANQFPWFSKQTLTA